jgi:hypothetical protein
MHGFGPLASPTTPLLSISSWDILYSFFLVNGNLIFVLVISLLASVINILLFSFLKLFFTSSGSSAVINVNKLILITDYMNNFLGFYYGQATCFDITVIFKPSLHLLLLDAVL